MMDKGVDVCVLCQVGEKDSKGGMELAVIDVFKVTDKRCRSLREDLKDSTTPDKIQVKPKAKSPRD